MLLNKINIVLCDVNQAPEVCWLGRIMNGGLTLHNAPDISCRQVEQCQQGVILHLLGVYKYFTAPQSTNYRTSSTRLTA